MIRGPSNTEMTTLKRLRLLAVGVLAVLSFVGCGDDPRAVSDDRRAASTVDSWFTPQPSMGDVLNGPSRTKWKELDTALFKEVELSREAEAEETLNDVSCRALSREEVTRFLGKPFQISGGRKPYLVRGLYLNRGTGAFTLYSKDDELVVEHGSLGRHAVPMKRQCLVVFLERPATRVFVTVHMDE